MNPYRLWTAHLRTLEGFYASDVYLIAATKDEAVELTMTGLKAWVAQRMLFGFFVPGSENFDSDDDAEFFQEMEAFYERVRTEATEKLVEVPSGVIINRKV